MELQSHTSAASLISRLREVIDPEAGAWLVGGVVRDQLAGKPCHDLDIILPGETRQIARHTADALNGAFFPLDEARGMYRVLLAGDDQNDVIDFCRFQAETLEADLALRDFTINAMAVTLHDAARWVDPMKGRQDLKDKVLRPCSETSFDNDPIRTIRAARMALEFNLHMVPGEIDLIRKAVPLLDRVSAERKRDELFKLLDGRRPASAIRLVDTFGALPKIIPDMAALKGVQQSSPHTLDAWEHTLAVVFHLDQLLDLFLSPDDLLINGGNLMLGLAAGKLGEFQPAIRGHFNQPLNLFRSRRSLCLLSALLHDIGKPPTQTTGTDGRIHFYGHEHLGAEMAAGIGKSLALSEAETQALATITAHHIDPRFVSAKTASPTRRIIYRFYRETRDFGVDACFLSLADFLSRAGYPPEQDAWMSELDRIAIYLEGWFKQRAVWIEPQKLLTGDEIMADFDLLPGKLIGEILDRIQEASAAGEVSNRDEALALAKTIIFRSARDKDA